MNDERTTILWDAAQGVYGSRAEAYGHPRDHFERTARLWSVFFGVEIPTWKVPMAFVLDKVARQLETPLHRDSLVDIAGYAAAAERLTEPEEVE